MVADAFEVGVDLDGEDDEPQVGGDGVVQREDALALPVELEFERVDLVVAAADAVGQFDVAGHERVHRLGELLVDEVRHFEHELAEHLQLFVERAVDGHGSTGDG